MIDEGKGVTVTNAGGDTGSEVLTESSGEYPPLDRLLAQAERQLARQMDAVLATDGLTVDQWRVLEVLSDGEGHTMSEIVAAIVVPGPTLTKIVDRLVDMAVVYRLVDVRDRRRVLALLSDAGRDLHERVRPQIAAAQAAALDGLGADAPMLLALLTRFTAGSIRR